MESAEDRLIARFFRPLATHPGALGLRDDAAFLVPPEGQDLVLKTDAVVAGIHSFPDDPPSALARRALRVNLSDLAAKGARPAAFLVSAAFPGTVDEAWLQSFADGLRADAEEFQCPLLGGDTDRTPGPATVAVFMVGWVPRGQMVQRAGARPGDVVMLSGTIGDGALGLELRKRAALAGQWGLTDAERDFLLDRYLVPQPRLGLADILRAHAHAAMDVSDGLVGDLAKLCRVSGVSAEIDTTRIPLSAAARRAVAGGSDHLATALTGGDDYELICVIAPDRAEAFRAQAERAGIAVTAVGRIVGGHGEPRFFDAQGRAMTFARGSFSHF
ncbi:MAG: thiamine-phosphate kinase [Pseudorhodoplanes sp.]|nr:thiamine-phosphate kinase [Pseudorhodoplanes sp.]